MGYQPMSSFKTRGNHVYHPNMTSADVTVSSSASAQSARRRHWPLTLWIGLLLLITCESLLFLDVHFANRGPIRTTAQRLAPSAAYRTRSSLPPPTPPPITPSNRRLVQSFPKYASNRPVKYKSSGTYPSK